MTKTIKLNRVSVRVTEVRLAKCHNCGFQLTKSQMDAGNTLDQLAISVDGETKVRLNSCGCIEIPCSL